MKFPYLKLGPNIYRPILPFTVSYRDGLPLKYFGLVDSGADYTLIAGELATLIGIKDIETGRKELVTGIGGASPVYFHNIMINIGGHDFRIEAGFTTDSTLSGLGYGLLGQVGLFDHCTIKFSRRKFEVEVTPVQPA